MRKIRKTGLPLFCLMQAAIALATQPQPMQPTAIEGNGVGRGDTRAVDVVTITKGKVTIGGKTIAYTARAGALVIKRDDGTPYHRMSYVSYTQDGPPSVTRPITFLWNGGPGGAAAWVQLTAFGPKRVSLPPLKPAGAGPYTFVNNDYSLLDQSDLVFIDAPGSGFSTTVGDGRFEEYDSAEKDALAFKRFIVRYLGVYERWNSPKFIEGESYGGPRDALVASLLQQDWVELSGVILLSTVLDVNKVAINFPSAGKGPDQWYIQTLPSLAATAQYLGRAGAGESVSAWAEKARQFARGPYSVALQQGDSLPAAEGVSIATEMSKLIGISPEVLIQCSLRPSVYQFRKEILRDRAQIIGRFDGRSTGLDLDASQDTPGYDPSWSKRNGVYRSAYMAYLSSDLGVHNPEPFLLGALNIPDANFDWTVAPRASGSGNLPNMRSSLLGDQLGAVARENPKIRFFWAAGYYDLATPFFSAEQDAEHLGLGERYSEVVRFKHYEGGHMFFEDEAQLGLLREDLRQFYIDTLKANEK